jgi:2-polyprenyl-6-methoxyphenol hydroxylase-like FAD-dependent oxidoreductase
VRFDSDELRVPEMGFIVENNVLQSSLFERMLELGGLKPQPLYLIRVFLGRSYCFVYYSGQIDVLCPSKVIRVIPAAQSMDGDSNSAGTDWPRLLLNDDRVLTTRLLVCVGILSCHLCVRTLTLGDNFNSCSVLQVAADGSNSAVRSAVGVGTFGYVL